MKIYPEAITGAEPPARPDEPRGALMQFYRAFNSHDLDGMSRNWLQSDEIAMSNPLGGIKRGWDEIRQVYERIFLGDAKVYVEFYDYAIQESADMFCAVGRERGHVELGKDSLELAIRTSRVYRKANGVWRQVHHHGSIDDPDLLARYQALVKVCP